MKNALLRGPIRSILVVRNDRFGEFLLIIPALRALKAAFQGCRITAVVSPQVGDLAGRVPYIDEYRVWPNSGQTLGRQFALHRMLRRSRFDAAVVFNPTKEFHLAAFLAGIGVRAGYSRKWGFLLSHRTLDERNRGDRHEIDYNLDLVRSVGADTTDKTLCLDLNDDIIQDSAGGTGQEVRAPFVAVHPFTSDPVKQWPVRLFVDLVARIRRECAVNVVVVGRPDGAVGAGDWRDVCPNLVGKTTLVQLACVLERSRLLVSCDSGPVHLASCVGTPSVVLFRNDLPGKTARRWGPVSRGSEVLERSNLADITVDEVMTRVKYILNRVPTPDRNLVGEP